MSDPHNAQRTAKLFGIDASRATKAQRTGTEAYATYLIQELIAVAAERGHRLRLYFNQAPAAGLFPEAEHVDIRIIPLTRLWTHLRLGWELRRHPPDLFFTPAHVIPIGYGGASVSTIHDLGYHFFPAAHTRSQLLYLRWSTQHNARSSRRIIADSQATKDDLVKLYGVEGQKVSVVYPGIDPQLAPDDDPQRLARVQEKYGISAPYFLYLGTLQPRKNLQRLIEAHAQSKVPAQLVLAGKEGWLSEPIVQSALRASAESGAGNAIRLTGYVEQEDKASLLSGALALLFPSLYEGFGFPILEAQRCHTAVLCADNSSQPEVAGDAAIIVDALDTTAIAGGIRRLMFEDDLRRKLVSAGRENVQRFEWRAAALQVMDELEKALSSN